MAIDTERIFLLATKKSQRVENLTYSERREFTDEQGKAEKNQGFCRQQDF